MSSSLFLSLFCLPLLKKIVKKLLKLGSEPPEVWFIQYKYVYVYGIFWEIFIIYSIYNYIIFIKIYIYLKNILSKYIIAVYFAKP